MIACVRSAFAARSKPCPLVVHVPFRHTCRVAAVPARRGVSRRASNTETCAKYPCAKYPGSGIWGRGYGGSGISGYQVSRVGDIGISGISGRGYGGSGIWKYPGSGISRSSHLRSTRAPTVQVRAGSRQRRCGLRSGSLLPKSRSVGILSAVLLFGWPLRTCART